ncbi:hypothetical protein CcaverHIS002_0703880 [Cutaneotrichosporon cavernicola]|uniref:C3H1-type domain-containing protein n=1 Tax=Cutaneotrichosporon cavernicola TaxID=279322 RepID=A0AA48QZ03_9TREE|nr:uncharacterized protein CcaverHIS019_0703960 [Cutaneotrichosporon cavernicola]BEI87042.1 hypothetical protein CcaverHIS002_0703880 [Cutaneotrichosporon cavernicola]BEI94815.1 hypothetical protein CcaverHIS019_0703960 [Cutaneotrichosporon cavernicola]BEJ02590.1 hypothetical protein CcaverHIS631_0703850 [Cutaneotrichosporon cavernicola]
MAPRHPLPQRPNVGYPAQHNASGGYPGNASGGYPGNASGGYSNTTGGYNAAGGYNASGGYPGWGAASGGYPYPQAQVNAAYASGGYPGYGAGAYGYGGYVAHPYASTQSAQSSAQGQGQSWRGRGGQSGRGGRQGAGHQAAPKTETENKRSEEEERWAKSGGASYIQGTGIKLDTPEQIAAWIAERRKKFPTAERVAERKEEEAAAIARGENPRKRKLDAARAAEEWGREASVDGKPVGVRDGKGVGARARGRARLQGPSRPAKATKADSDTVDSDSDSDSGSDSGSSDVSSDEDEDEDEDEGSDDAKVEDEADEKDKDKEAEENKTPAKQACRFFARGQCRFGSRCKLEHTRPNTQSVPEKKEEPKGPPKPRPPRAPRGPAPNAFARPSMLGAILANPIENTLSQLSQTIRFLVANDMLHRVEVRAGQAEEERQEREKIVVVEEGGP